MKNAEIDLIGYLIVLTISITLLFTAFWNANNQWHVKTDLMYSDALVGQKIITGLSIGSIPVMLVITILIGIFTYCKVYEAFGDDK